MLQRPLDVTAHFGGGAAILRVLEKVVEERRGNDFRVRVFFTLIPCREIENPKKRLFDNKGETIHIHNKSDGYVSIG